MNENMFGPLVKLSLEPTILDAQTTKERLTMRLRVAGEDQLGSNTPRPQAPSDCLISFQIHESMINNALSRLQLEGKTFTLPSLPSVLPSDSNGRTYGTSIPNTRT